MHKSITSDGEMQKVSRSANGSIIAVFQKEIRPLAVGHYTSISNITRSNLKLISPLSSTDKIISKDERLIGDKELLSLMGISGEYEKAYNTLPNWYKQQVLKILAASHFFRLGYSNVIIVDGDSFITAEISNIHLCCIKKREPSTYLSMFSDIPSMHDYRSEAEYLFARKLSPIVNYGNWSRKVFDKLFEGHSGQASYDWNSRLIEPLARSLSGNAGERPLFSEYLLYAAAHIYYNKEQTIYIASMFRRADLLDSTVPRLLSIESSKARYEIIAFEKKHKSSRYKKLLARLAWYFRINIA
jgi:hypothetical protein